MLLAGCFIDCLGFCSAIVFDFVYSFCIVCVFALFGLFVCVVVTC